MKNILLSVLFLALLSPVFSQEKVVVEANRIPESANTVGASVVVIQPKEDIVDALGKVPGLVATSSGGEKTLSDATGTKLTYLLDGVSLNRPDMSEPDLHGVDWRNVEKVEIYSNAVWWGGTGTVINIITKKSLDKLSGEIGASVDNRVGNTQFGRISVGTQVANVAVEASNSSNKSARAQSDSGSQTASVKVGSQVLNQDLVLQYSFSKHAYDLPSALSKAQYDSNPDQSVPNKGSKNNTNTENLGRVTLTGEVLSGKYDLSGSILNRAVVAYAQSNLLQGTAGAHEKWIIPISDSDYVALQTGSDLDKSNLKTKTDAIQYYSTGKDSNVDRTVSAVGVSITWSWSEDTVLATVTIRPQSFSMGALQDYSIPASGSLIWNLGFLHLKGTLAQTVRNPLVDEAYDLYGASSFIENPNLAPEKDLTADFGLEAALGSLVLKSNPSVTWASNDIVSFSDENWNTKNINASGTDVKIAVKSSAEYTVVKGVVASLGYTFARATDKDGNVIKETPTHSGRLALDTDFGGIDFSKTSGFEAQGDGTKVEGQNLLNAYLQYVISGIKLKAEAKNILDDRTPTYIWSNSGWYPSEARTISLSVSWTF